LVVLAAAFAAVDYAIGAFGEVRARAVRDEGREYSGTAARLLEHEGKIRARLLAGRVLCLSTGAALSTLVAIRSEKWWVVVLAGLAVAFGYSAAVEILGTLARKWSSWVALPLLRWFRPLEIIMVPFAAPLAWLGEVIGRVSPSPREQDAEKIVDLEVESVIERGEETGSIPSDHADLLRGVLEFKDTVVREIMVPRTQILAIDIDMPVNDVVRLILEGGHSRYPVYRDRLDKMLGVIYAKDVFQAQRKHSDEPIDLNKLLRKPVFFVSETQKIGTLLKQMQSRRVHLAIVVDEFGGTNGIVSLEDILEEIVGDIRDEHDDDETQVTEVSPGHFLVDASMSIYDLQDRIGVDLRDDDGGDYDSVGGLIIDKAGKVPENGETLSFGNVEFIVRERDPRRVRRVEVVPKQPDETTAEINA
jgi:putative hemolysin